MATVGDHLSVEEVEERFGGCQDATASGHFQVIWLLARGHTVSQVSATTAFGERWIEQLLARYNAEGPEALGDFAPPQRGQDHTPPITRAMLQCRRWESHPLPKANKGRRRSLPAFRGAASSSGWRWKRRARNTSTWPAGRKVRAAA